MKSSTNLKPRRYEQIDLSLLDPALAGSPFPYFQPIISIEDKKVIGYETLARGHDLQGNVVSVGPLFHRIVPENLELLKETDHYIREEAIRRFILSGLHHERKLFVNILPRWLEYKEPDMAIDEAFPLLDLLNYYNLSPESVVLEITEGEYSLEPRFMTDIIEKLKESGFLIAVDDFGAGFSNVARIGQIKPKYIKLDLHLIRRGFSEEIYKEILNSLSFLSEKIGAILLVEGIEHEEELYGALDIGARYLQGYFLGHPSEQFESLEYLDLSLQEYLHDFSKKKLNQLQGLIYFKDIVESSFRNYLARSFQPATEDGRVILPAPEPFDLPMMWREHLRLAYILDPAGVQLSPNYNLKSDSEGAYSWVTSSQFVGKDWSWRPYFLQFMARREAREEDFGYSEPYRDIRTGELILTFVYTYNTEMLLCLDFSISHIHDPLWHTRGLPSLTS